MVLISRFSRLIKADLHAVLDHVEEPGILLKQALREMEAEIKESELYVKNLEYDRECLSGHILDCRQAIVDLDAELDLCFESENENLARSLIKRKLEVSHLQKQLQRKDKILAGVLEKKQLQLAEHRQQYKDLQHKAELFEHNVGNDDLTIDNATAKYGSIKAVSSDEVEVAFLREKKQRLLAREGKEHE